MINNPSLTQVLRHYSGNSLFLGVLHFAGHLPSPPSLAYQVHFQRIELVLDGELEMQVGSTLGMQQELVLKKGDLLYLPADSWNKPVWNQPVKTLSILVGKQSFGLSLQRWDGTEFDSVTKTSVARRGPRTGTFILQAIEELSWHAEDQNTCRLLIGSLLSHIVDLMLNPPEAPSKSKALFEAVRSYLEQHYPDPLTRESVAEHFYISPSYLSQLFQKEGNIKFNEHLNYIRLERAKYLLKEYDMKIKEVAHRCGFPDHNYFCRLFKKRSDRSPSQYRAHYRSTTQTE